MRNRWTLKEIYKDDLSRLGDTFENAKEEFSNIFSIFIFTLAVLIWSFIKAILTLWIFVPTEDLKLTVLNFLFLREGNRIFLDAPSNDTHLVLYLWVLFMFYIIGTVILVGLNFYYTLFHSFSRVIENTYMLALKLNTIQLPLSAKEVKSLNIKTLYNWHLYLSKNYTRKLPHQGRVTIDIPDFIQNAIKESTGYSIYFDKYQDCDIEKALNDKVVVYTHYDKDTEPAYKDAIKKLYNGIEFKGEQ